MSGIAALIVTYNRRDKLLRCIDAVMRQTWPEQPDIVIVDNNSSDGTGACIREYREHIDGSGDRVHYFNTGLNNGGAGGFCYGIRKAAGLGYDYVWLMDDDCVPADDALERFMEYDRDHRGEYGFLSGRVLWHDGSLCRMNIQRETVFRSVSEWGRQVIPVEMASFVSLLIPMNVIREVGLPFRKFFIWTDDWEYTRRISRKYRCLLITASTALHDTSTNSGADISAADPARLYRYRYLYRNDVYLYRREGLRGLCYEAARLALHTARIAASSDRLRAKTAKFRILAGGTLEGLRFYPEPERVMPGCDND